VTTERNSTMEKYADIDNDSGVIGYEIQATSITVWFSGSPRSYTYSYGGAGQHHVEQMKRLARSGDGLNAYINENVKFQYDH
jgi:hypothetical protein